MRNLAVFLLLVLAVAGCSGSQGVGNWFSPGKTTSAKSSGVFYAAVDGLAVLDEPRSSARTVGRLARHQKVTRTKLENGFARVKAGKLEGWVVNSKLLWKLPASGVATTGAKEPGEAEAAEPAEAADTAPAATAGAASEASTDAADAEGRNTDVESAPPPAPEAKPAAREKPPAKNTRSGAAVFDPY